MGMHTDHSRSEHSRESLVYLAKRLPARSKLVLEQLTGRHTEYNSKRHMPLYQHRC